MEYSIESKERLEKIRKLKEAGVVVYANNYRGKQDISQVRAQDSKIKTLERIDNEGVIWDFQIAGRIMTYKSHGKIAFAKLRDHSGDIQICFVKDKVDFNTWKPHPDPLLKGEGKQNVVKSLKIDGEEKDAFKIAEKFLYTWDYIWVKWDLFHTKHGELTIYVKEFQILSKAVRPLPEKWHGVTDEETIYRQRYLDLIMNDDSYWRFQFRSHFIKAVREFYHKNGFIEVETPVLWNAASWAAAKPFITHHNDYDEDFFLRIAPETALKKTTVWRFEKVFELSRNFRNEWSDPSHVQEYSEFEHYAAWWSFEDNITFTEQMFDYIFGALHLDRKINIKDKEGNIKQVDFTTPWQRIDYIAGVKEKSGIDIGKYAPADEEKLRADIKKAGYTWEWIDNQVTATMIDYLYKKVLRPWIVWPAFVYNYPKTMQPLARQSDSDENIVEQFQLVLNGWEVLKAYSELVDPKIQKENFEQQSGAMEKWDEEATSGDDDFVLAMEYGMPCQSGWGMGVERIVALLTEQDNLRDVQLFPLMKSEKKENKKENKKETNLAVVLMSKQSNLAPWQEMNTIAHLTAAYGAKEGRSLFLFEDLKTQDGVNIAMNTTHAIMIKTANTHQEIKNLIVEAKKKNLLVTEFTREMLKTSDDNLIAQEYKVKNFDEVEHLWILIYGKMSDVKKITESFELYTWNSSSGGSQTNFGEKYNDFTQTPQRENILKMLDKYATWTRQHLLQVWDIMEYFADKLWEDTNYWWTVWVLHDIDWDYIEKDGNKHCREEFISMCNEHNVPDSMIRDIQSHLYTLDPSIWIPPDSLVRKYLSSVDELSGLIWAYFRMIPSDTVADIKVSSIKKKIKDKSFAAGVDRHEVMNCETMLWISLDEFVEDIKVALGRKKYQK